MCLEYKYTKKELKEWLKEQPEMITAYKLVTFSNGRIYPWVQGKTPFERDNLLKKEWKWSSKKYVEVDCHDKYMAYYHLLLNKESLLRYFGVFSDVVECQIPKKYVTDMGVQWNLETVITRGFTIVGHDEYLD